MHLTPLNVSYNSMILTLKTGTPILGFEWSKKAANADFVTLLEEILSFQKNPEVLWVL